MQRKPAVNALTLLYACAGLQFVRFYASNPVPYLNMQAYLNGRERLPFQTRVFPIFLLRLLAKVPWLAHQHGLDPANAANYQEPLYVLNLAAFALAAYFTQKLYSRLTERGLLRYLVFPVFLFTAIWTYVLHVEANFSYPYDLSSLAFFTAGLFFLYERRFVPLLLVVAVGTTNRETTLFLILLFVIDAASSNDQTSRFQLRFVSWTKVAILSATWLTIKFLLAHHFGGNDASESFLRIHDNLHQLRPRLLPALLNVCGYTLPIVVVCRRFLRPSRFRAYLWVLPFWLVVMFCSGVLVETRIYGELCSFSAIALVLILENAVDRAAWWRTRILPCAPAGARRSARLPTRIWIVSALEDLTYRLELVTHGFQARHDLPHRLQRAANIRVWPDVSSIMQANDAPWRDPGHYMLHDPMRLPLPVVSNHRPHDPHQAEVAAEPRAGPTNACRTVRAEGAARHPSLR